MSKKMAYISHNLFVAPPVGFEPTTYRLHLSPCFHEAWTISSPWSGWTLGALVSSLYGAPLLCQGFEVGSHGIGVPRCASEFSFHRYPNEFQPRFIGEAAFIVTAGCSTTELQGNDCPASAGGGYRGTMMLMIVRVKSLLKTFCFFKTIF